MSETNVEPIEQLRHDRDKYIGMWRSQCNIAEEVMKERDRLMAELAETREEYGHKCAKCGSVLQLVRLGKHQCQYCEMESALTAELAAEKKFSQDRIDDIEELHLELARYKQGVEVRDFVNHYGILENEFELHSHLRDKQVRVLVMKVEE